MISVCEYGRCRTGKRELFRALLARTALVRCGLKPAEIYQVPHCCQISLTAQEPPRICRQLPDILAHFGLPWRVLRNREGQSLVFFYDPELLTQTLNDPLVREYLESVGYGCMTGLDSWLDALCERFAQPGFPHEIGLFLGYPLKDVKGFMQPGASPVYCGAWKVYGSLEPSLSIMNRFRQVTRMAEIIVDQADNWDLCVERITQLKNYYKEYESCLI